MPDFASQYKKLFDTFGSPLGRSQAIDSALLKKAEQRLGIKIPAALRAYYEVAGNERVFNRAQNRFMSPAKWFVDRRQLVFLQENQSVFWWAVSLKSPGAQDPMVSQGLNDEKIAWHKQASKCSTFISVMLHYHAVCDGFKFCKSGAAPDDAYDRLKKDGWKYVGEVQKLWAFSRPNQVVCITPSGGQYFMPSMILMAGGKTKADIKAISDSLGVKLS